MSPRFPWASTCLLLIFANVASAVPRQRLLMDFSWRFHLGDPPDAAQQFDFPEIADLAKMRMPDLARIPKLIAARIDPVAAHLGDSISFVQLAFPDSVWRRLDLPHDWAVELPFKPD